MRLLAHPDAAHCAAGALANLTVGSPTAARQAFEAGALQPLLQLLEPMDRSTLELSGCEDDAAAWVLGAIAHLVDFHPEVQSQATAALPAACELLSASSGSANELLVHLLAALANQERLKRGETRTPQKTRKNKENKEKNN